MKKANIIIIDIQKDFEAAKRIEPSLDWHLPQNLWPLHCIIKTNEGITK